MNLEDRLFKSPPIGVLRRLYEVDYDRFIDNYLQEKNSKKRKEIVKTIRKTILKNTNPKELESTKDNEEVFETLDYYIRKSIIDFPKKSFRDARIARKNGDEKLAKKLESHVYRLNGVNYSITHFFASAQEGINRGTSPRDILTTILHDSIEDKIANYKKIIGEIPSPKEIKGFISDLLQPLKANKNFDYNFHCNVLDRLTKKPTKDYMEYMAEAIKLPYFYIFYIKPFKSKAIKQVLHTLNPKLDDRLNNTVTMRPIDKEFNAVIRETCNEDVYSDTCVIADRLENLLDIEEKEGIIYDSDAGHFINKDGKILTISDLPTHYETFKEVNEIKTKYERVHNSIDDLNVKSNTTKPNFIIGMIYKNMIVVSQTNRFLSEHILSDPNYNGNPLVESIIQKRDELVKRTIYEIRKQYSHPLAMHKSLDAKVALNCMRDARNSRDYSRFTPMDSNESLPVRNGVVQYWLAGTLNKDSVITNMLNEPWDHDNDNLKFNLYLTLEHLFKQFVKNPNSYFSQFTKKGKLLI